MEILLCYPYTFPIEEVGRFVNISCQFLFDHVLNSHDHFVLYSVDNTRRNLILITLRLKGLKVT